MRLTLGKDFMVCAYSELELTVIGGAMGDFSTTTGDNSFLEWNITIFSANNSSDLAT